MYVQDGETNVSLVKHMHLQPGIGAVDRFFNFFKRHNITMKFAGHMWRMRMISRPRIYFHNHINYNCGDAALQMYDECLPTRHKFHLYIYCLVWS